MQQSGLFAPQGAVAAPNRMEKIPLPLPCAQARSYPFGPQSLHCELSRRHTMSKRATDCHLWNCKLRLRKGDSDKPASFSSRNCTLQSEFTVQFQVMETLGILSPMPDDVGEEQVEKMRETFLTDFMHVSRISSTWAVTRQFHNGEVEGSS